MEALGRQAVAGDRQGARPRGALPRCRRAAERLASHARRGSRRSAGGDTVLMGYDVAAVRACFPALAEGAAHFDGPGGSQVAAPVADAVAGMLRAAVANRGTATPAEQGAEGAVLGARAAMADLLGSSPGGVVFGRSMTALTFEMSRALAKTWAPDD